MKRVTISLIAATAIGSAASPALAQDGYVLPPPPPPISYPQPSYSPAPVAVPASQYPAVPQVHTQMPAQPQVQYLTQYQETGPVRHYGYDEEYAPVQYHPAPAPHHAEVRGGLPPVPSVGYTGIERDAWLAECRQRYYGKNRKGGGIIGGLLGAVGGGIAGHELVNGSNTRKLGGTLIGAGIGGLLGAGIGAAIGASADKRKMDECEAYLVQYTGGRGPGPVAAPGYGYAAYPAYTVMMVPVQVPGAYIYSAPKRVETKYVIEEVIEEKVIVPRTKYVKSAPATKYVKSQPTKYVKQRYAK